MVRIIIFFIILTQFSFAYEYDKSAIYQFLKGCKKGGGSYEFCNCQANVIVNNIPQIELTSFSKDMYKIYKNPNAQISDKHRGWMNKMYNCQGK